MRVFIADVETVAERGGYRRPAFSRIGVTEFAAVEVTPDRFVCVAQGIDVVNAGAVDLTGRLESPVSNGQATVLGTRLGIGTTALRGMTVGQIVRSLIVDGWIPDKANGRFRCVLARVTLFDEAT